MKILLIDNYDSFTYNLVHYLEGAGADVTVWRNDAIDFNQLNNFAGIVISPGPGLPNAAGDLLKLIDAVVYQKPVLGVCLGFQALIEYFGGSIYNQSIVKHGVAEKCMVTKNTPLFKEIPASFNVGLYHSWAAKKEDLPETLILTAYSENDVVMAFAHNTLPVYGVQFHPESILTEHGHALIKNYLELI